VYGQAIGICSINSRSTLDQQVRVRTARTAVPGTTLYHSHYLVVRVDYNKTSVPCPALLPPAEPPCSIPIGYHAVSFPRSCVSCRPGMEVLACPHPLDSSSLPASRQGQEERSHAEFHPGQIAAVRQRPPSSSHGRHGQHVFVSCLFFEVRRTPLGRRWGSSSSTAVLP